MQLKFDQIEIEGFRSIVDNQVFSLDRPGLNMVKGTNGAGKTTLFEALVWCLYGANLKGTVSAKVQSWKEVRGEKYKGTHVAIWFSSAQDKYEIVRTIKYHAVGDVLIVRKNGEQIPELDKADTQKYINDILTMDFQTFMNSFMFGQRMTRLVESSSADKRKLFEELFDMEWIGEMRERVAKDSTKLDLEIYDMKHSIKTKEISIGMHGDSVDEVKEKIEVEEDEVFRKITLISSDIAGKTGDIDAHEAKIISLKDQIDALPPIQDINSRHDEIVRLEGELLPIESKIDEFFGEKHRIDANISINREELEAVSDEEYKQWKELFIKAEYEAKKLADRLFEGGTFLSKEEIEEVGNDYDIAKMGYTKEYTEMGRLNKDLYDFSDTCPACNRPYDNAADLQAAKARLEKSIKELSIKVDGLKIKLDTAEKDMATLKKYKETYNGYRILQETEPDSPDEIKAALEKEIATFTNEFYEIKKSLTPLDKDAKRLEDEIQKLVIEEDKLKDTKLANERIEFDKKDLEREIYIHKEKISSARMEIDLLKEENPRALLEALEKELKDKEKRWSNAVEEKQDLNINLVELEAREEVLKFWLKDVFAANGLKAYIFKAMLDDLNQYTTKYGTKLGISIRFSLDLTKTSAPFSTICSIGDMTNKEYKEFSGGQKSRLDIVMLMAMHDLISSTTDINLLVMDEVFEGLDEQGESDVFELIREKAEGRSVYVISHSQVLDTLHSKTIELVNNNGKTELP